MKTIVKIFCLILLTTLTPFVYGKTFNKVVVFGDSLSDTGNMYRKFLFQAPKSPYYRGHFSDGPVWSEYLVDQFPGVTLEDHAFGAAQTWGGSTSVVNYLAQINSHVQKNQGKNFKNTLHFSFIGNVNYLFILGQGFDVTPADINMAVSNINQGVQNLINAGAKNLFVFNLPSSARTPWAIEKVNAGNKSFSEVAEAAIIAHNQALAEMIENLHKDLILKNSDVSIELIDTFDYFDEIIEDIKNNPETQPYLKVRPGHHAVLTEKCYTGDYSGKNGKVCDFPDEYIFWDHLHPTTAFFKAVANKIIEVLEFEYDYTGAMSMMKLTVQQQEELDRLNRIMNL